MTVFLLVETTHTGRRIFYRIHGFGRSANELTFRRGDINKKSAHVSELEEISVADYFAKEYRKLLYPNLPCINAMKGNQKQSHWLPMEVVRVSL